MSLPDSTNKIVNFLKKQDTPEKIEATIILGSGLGDFITHINHLQQIPYAEIPGMPESSVEGHNGNLIFGKVNGRQVMAFSGRFHYYEGFSFEQVAAPIYLAKAFDTNKLIISNVAGAINTSFSVGDLMIIKDIIRSNIPMAPRGYSPYRYLHQKWIANVQKLAAELQLVTHQGSYLYVPGPHYETKAEIQAFRRMGADAVGMSTAPELAEAARLELKSVAISLISNMAAGITQEPLNHKEVQKTAALRKEDFAKLVTSLITRL